jgi:hypothetical protein
MTARVTNGAGPALLTDGLPVEMQVSILKAGCDRSLEFRFDVRLQQAYHLSYTPSAWVIRVNPALLDPTRMTFLYWEVNSVWQMTAYGFHPDVVLPILASAMCQSAPLLDPPWSNWVPWAELRRQRDHRDTGDFASVASMVYLPSWAVSLNTVGDNPKHEQQDHQQEVAANRDELAARQGQDTSQLQAEQEAARNVVENEEDGGGDSDDGAE